jgi:UDP-glucose 4-epimerase
VYNVGQGRSYSLLDLIDLLRSILQTELRWNHTAARPGDVRYTLADITRAAQDLGYHPKVSFEEGIVRTAAYFARGARKGGRDAAATASWAEEKAGAFEG